jgi:hypothetical protein
MNMDTYDDNMDKNEKNIIDSIVGLVEIEPHKSQTRMPIEISFSPREITKISPNGPIYIAK